MKKFLTISTLAISVLSFAQINFKNTRFGVTAGFNYSVVNDVHRPSGPRYTFQAGALALIPIGTTNQFFLQPEVLFYGAGETGKDSDFKNGNRDTNGYNAVYANNYISVPVFFKAYLSEAPSEFFMVGGPRFNFLVNQNVKNVPIDRPYYDPDYNGPSNFYGKASSFNFGLGLGFGYSIKREWEIAVKYDLGLSNTYKGLVNELSSSTKSEQVVSIGVNYIFK
ncbi:MULTISPECIES: porin family protein [Elizabethkingia]|uniref:Outer membrane protein beta-barrel domain-containing protein n=1 Tax=Elizabethkingia ursingii TaxID=1756150 RepID=A0AAJ3TQN1_9FLAO|nr:MULTISPECIES: porin family protein [Elizabethkingia]AQW96137.1 hypothetical protein BBD30_01155 [Elizabethkingia anophelis]AQX10793.1 hypothetical protein BBD34_14715 [Elizabethkingia ursingii]OPB60832.1 hypothetical protein BAS07_17540 [Elizabethkingia anophelis]OPB78950.1 hypothetical protein BAY32_18940 [Elizabethkingia ursingii]OPB91641.1 hypothetical protein BB021_17120 [Elizabethkingia ursingii]